MAKNTLADLDTTTSNNTDVLGQSTQGSADANQLDAVDRATLALLARFYADIGGVVTVGGSANAITITSASTYQALETGLTLKFRATATTTDAATLNLDGLGAKKLRRPGDAATQAGDVVEDGVYDVVYVADYDSSAGGWALLNPTISASSLSAASVTEQLTGTDTAKFATADSVAGLWEKGADVASGSTVTLGEGGYFHVTGTTTITDIDWATAKNGRGAWVVFDGILTLTHNATTLKLPTGANITTAAGDRAYFVQDSGDNVICLLYQRADGTALAAATSTGIGDSQSWDDGLTRSEGTSYQNTTGKPIMVAVAVLGSTNSGVVFFQVSTNGSAWEDVVTGVSSGGYSQVWAIVPNNHYYRVVSSGFYSVASWAELR